VFWVHADNETTFTQDFKSIARKLGLSSNLDGEDLLMAVRYCIEANPPWVLILDNADNLRLFGVGHTAQDALNTGDQASSLDRFIPRGPRGQIMWTSRDERISGGLVAARRAIKVSSMTPDEAKELFDSVGNTKISTDKAKDIAALLAELDWLPLAISQAAAYIRKTMTTIEEYMLRLKEGKKRWRILKQSQTDRFRRREVSNSILETWSISMKHLQIENKTSYQILHIHAFMDNQNIPFELIKQAALYSDESNVLDHVHEEYDSSSSSSSSDSDSDDDQVTEAIARLCEFSFLSIQDTGDGNRAYKVHKLVQEAMRYELGRKERKKEEKYFSAAALGIISSLLPVSVSKNWNEYEKYTAHAQRACEWATLCGGESTAADILTTLSDYLYKCGRWREGEIIDQRVYELRKTTLGDKHLDTIESMAKLGATYYELGKYKEYEKLIMEVLALRREILGDRHPRTIDSMACLATVSHALGGYEKAEGLYIEVLALRREILGDKHPATIDSMACLATVSYAFGDYEKAEGLFIEVLALQPEILGEKHVDMITNMVCLAATYHALGRLEEAEGLHVKVLALQREIFGERHPHTVWNMSGLAATYHDHGRYEEAERMHAEALSLRREILGERHPDTIRSMAYLASTCHALGKHEEHEKMTIEVLALRREILGDKHPDTVRSMEELASQYRARGRNEDADKLIQNLG
jgi:tetratricopeptide (TPR) repeat protein